MYCAKCGKEQPDGQNFCPSCGTNNSGSQVNNQQQYVNYAPPPTPMLAILGLVFAFVMPIAGLILSILGLKQAKRENGNGHGLALAGLIVSIVYYVLAILVIIFYIMLILFAISVAWWTY